MKMIRTLLCLSAAGICTGLTAQASVLFSDGFNYTVNDDLGYGSTSPTWTPGSAASANMSINGTDLTYAGLNDLGGGSLTLNDGASAGSPAYASLGGAQTSGSIYYSFLVDCTSLPTSNTYLTGLTPSSHLQLNGSGSDALDFYAKNSGSGWVMGVRSTGVSAVYESTVLSANTTYLAVLEYTFGGAASLYLDPTAGGAQPGTASATVTPTSYVPDISAVGFKAQTPTIIGNFEFDNVFVGTTWADVTQVSAVPEPSTLALGGLGLLGLAAARRMRR